MTDSAGNIKTKGGESTGNECAFSVSGGKTGGAEGLRWSNALYRRGSCSRSWLFAAGERLGDSEVAIGAMTDYSLTRCQPYLLAIELYLDDIRLE
jgi:hypothetical protein